MKKIKLLKSVFAASVMVFGMSLTSCGGNDGSISKGDVKDAVKDSYFMCDSIHTVSFSTGYYEIDYTLYLQLQQLKNAGMITAEFEVKTENKKHWISYWRDEYEIKKVKHMFARVELTEKGKELKVYNEVKLVNKSDKDIIDKLNSNEAFEDKDEIKYLTVAPEAIDFYETQMGEKVSNFKSNYEDSVVVVDSTSYNTPAQTVDNKYTEKADGYENAILNVFKVDNNMYVGKLKIDEVYNIECTPKMQEEGIANAEVLFEIVNKTPFYFIFSDNASGYFTKDVSLKHYIDKGWVIIK